MSTLVRTLAALPVAAAAIALFAATSAPDEWLSWTADTVDGTVNTDSDGIDEGLVRVVVVGPIQSDSEVRVFIRNDDARGSLEVSPADGSASPGRVKDGYEILRGLPSACAENTTTDGDLGSCTVEVRVRFEGRDDDTESITVQGAIGAWSYSGTTPDDRTYSIEVDYDGDPPAE